MGSDLVDQRREGRDAFVTERFISSSCDTCGKGGSKSSFVSPQVRHGVAYSMETMLVIQGGPPGGTGLLDKAQSVGELAITRSLRGFGDRPYRAQHA